MKGFSLTARRRIVNKIVLSLSVLAAAFGLFWLAWIMLTTLVKGASALSLKLITQMTPPPGSDGGLLNAFAGSALMIIIALLVGTPVGILAGTHLAEYARRTRMGGLIRFINDILLSAPSVVVGLFIYELVVQPIGHFSGWAGGLALAVILLPVVVRTTDEALKLVPTTMREAGLALGLPQWKVTVHLVYAAAKTSMLTGVILAVARISGETAPLLFTALNNQYWTWNASSPMANVPVVIFQYALSPYKAWHALAWAGALVMTLVVLGLSIAARSMFNRGDQK